MDESFLDDLRSATKDYPDRRLERYLGLEQYLESRLRPAHFWRALRGDKIDVRVVGARSYQEAVSNLKAHRWDVLLGFSPVVSMEALVAGYRPIGRMVPQESEYRSILFTRKGSPLRGIKDISLTTRIALGDFFSATKYYIPMSLLRGRSARITLNLSTAEIAEQVRSGKADVGAMAGNPQSFKSLHPEFEILLASAPLPASVIAISPEMADPDRNRLQQALIAAPDSIRAGSAANYGTGLAPDYRHFARQVAEGKAFSACLRNKEGVFNLRCPLMINRSLLEQSSVFQTLNELRGRGIRLLMLQQALQPRNIEIENPHQIEIRP